MPSVLARLIVVAVLFAGAAPAGALAQSASPKMVECHDAATKRYIADFQQVGLPQRRANGFPIIVTAFENDKSKYEEYLAECMERTKLKKDR
jgi:hypothetical protein